MEYSIYKDEKVENTVDKIKNILKSIGIETEVQHIRGDKNGQTATSTRIVIKETAIGTNGKGTCSKNALASGYAEFLERLQNRILIDYSPYDCKYITYDELKETGYFRETIQNKLADSFIKIFDEQNQSNSIKATPFYNVKDNKIHYIPESFINYLQGTNGMAAGNTKEEALVQGISEICERYAVKKVILEKISMPDIPKELYINYDNIKNMINDYEKIGYKIYIKDASLGQNIPAICLIAENKKENIFLLQFGAHPSLQIAIERCLTEVVQGADITDEEYFLQEKNHFYFSNKMINYILDNDLLISQLFRSRRAFEYDNPFREFLLNKTNNYKFVTNPWINPNEIYTNKEILNFLLKNIKAITNNNIYIRDYSFLKFPAFYIFIPTMSLVFNINEDFVKGVLDYNSWQKYTDQKYDDKYNDIKNLISACNYCIKFFDFATNRYPWEYLLLLCYITVNDRKNIINQCNLLKEILKYKSILTNKVQTRINIICDYYSDEYLKLNENEKIAKLKENYDEENIKKAIIIIKTTTFDTIKKFILKENIFKSTTNTEIQKKYQKILEDKYKENTPNQMDLQYVFSDQR